MYFKNPYFNFQLHAYLQGKLDRALKDKLVALEDKLSLLVQLRDAEQRIVDTDAFVNIIKVICECNIYFTL